MKPMRFDDQTALGKLPLSAFQPEHLPPHARKGRRRDFHLSGLMSSEGTSRMSSQLGCQHIAIGEAMRVNANFSPAARG